MEIIYQQPTPRQETDRGESMSTVTEDEASGQPKYVDVSFAISFIAMFVISFVMNPISFLYHSRKKTLICALYTYLAISDFMVNLWHPLVSAGYLLQESRPADHDASMNERCTFLVYFTVSSYSGLLINIILICGWIKISRPGVIIPKGPVLRLVMALLGLYTLLQFIVAFSPDPIGPPYWASWSMAIHYRNSFEVVVWVTYLIFFIPGPFAVVAALQRLFQNNEFNLCPEVSKPECVKVIFLCIPNFIYPIFLSIDFMSWHRGEGTYSGGNISQEDASMMSFFGKTFIPIFKSAWNPLFICILTKDLRTMVRDLRKNSGGGKTAVTEHSVL